MLKEFAEFLAKQAVDAKGAQVRGDDRTKDILVINPDDGTVLRQEGAPARRDHYLLDIPALTNWVADHAADNIWYSRNGIVALWDDDDRRDKASITLEISKQIETLTRLEASKEIFDQRKLLRLWKVDLRGCIAPDMIDTLRAIKFTQAAEGQVQLGKSSLGKTAMAELSGASALPEVVQVNVPIFHNCVPYFRAVMECAILINEETNNFYFYPFPGEIEKAIIAGENHLGGLLENCLARSEEAKANTRLYYGEPTRCDEC